MSQDVGGGAGQGIAPEDYLWWPPHEVSGQLPLGWRFPGLFYAGGGTRTPDTRIMIGPWRSDWPLAFAFPAIAGSAARLGGAGRGQIFRVGDTIRNTIPMPRGHPAIAGGSSHRPHHRRQAGWWRQRRPLPRAASDAACAARAAIALAPRALAIDGLRGGLFPKPALGREHPDPVSAIAAQRRATGALEHLAGA
jgi:hypothetical protein